MATQELQHAPSITPVSATSLEDLDNGVWLVTSATRFNNLNLPGTQSYGKLEIYKWSVSSGVAYFYPRSGPVRVWACYYAPDGWSAWAN